MTPETLIADFEEFIADQNKRYPKSWGRESINPDGTEFWRGAILETTNGSLLRSGRQHRFHQRLHGMETVGMMTVIRLHPAGH